MKKQNLLTRTLLLFALIVGSMSVWAESKPWSCEDPSTTLDLKTVSSSNIGTFGDAISYYLDDQYLIVSGYASRITTKPSWISHVSAGSSSNTWDASDPFKGSDYYTTKSYATLQAGRAIVYSVTNLKSLKVYGKNSSISKYLDIFIYTKSGSDYTKVEEIKYTTDANNHIWESSETLDPAEKYYIYITGVSNSNSRVFEVAFERAIPAPTAITFKTGETTYTNGGETKNDLGSEVSVNVTIEPNQTADVYYTLDGTIPTTSSTKYTSAVAITGPCTLTALATNSVGSTTASAAFKFSRANGLAFGSDEYTAYLTDGTFSTTLTNPNSLDVTYESLDEDVATVASDGTVTLKAAGETIISATFAGNDTYAAGSADYTLTVSNKTAVGIAFASDFIHIEDPTYNSEISAPVALTNPHSVTVTYTSSDATVATVSSTGAITPKKLGTTTITASFAGDATYEASEVSYTLKLGLQDAGLAFDEDSYEMTYSAGANYTMDFIKDTDAAATFSSSNTDVATVNATTGEVTVVSVGSTTITATTAKTSDYKAGEAEYTLTVTENTSAPTITALIPVLTETFDTNNETGGNDGTWGSISTTPSPSFDLTGWTYDKAYAAKTCVRTGKAGYITSPALGVEGDVTLTFKMASWSGDTNNGYVDILNGGTFDGESKTQQLVSIKKAEWDSFELTLYDVTEETKIKFWDNGNNKRLFIDEVKVLQSTTPTVSYTVPTTGWGTFCSPYKLDLSNEATEIEAYAVTGFDATAGTITFKKVEGVVPAKTPLVIKGESGAKKIAVDQTEATGTAPATNLLTGYLSPTYYDGDRETNTVFGMSDGNFHKLTAGTIPANRAVLSMSTTEANKVGAAEGRFTFIFDDDTTTGITDNKRETTTNNGECFNLAGQRVAQPTKGLYIVNGRKVVIK